jgi:hypothetical protein
MSALKGEFGKTFYKLNTNDHLDMVYIHVYICTTLYEKKTSLRYQAPLRFRSSLISDFFLNLNSTCKFSLKNKRLFDFFKNIYLDMFLHLYVFQHRFGHSVHYFTKM